MNDYPAISDHGLIGDLQTAALVTTDATIDWFCAPRFDSPSVFASLLDAGKGGRFQIAPAGTGWRTYQMYFPGSACLITRFMSDEGVAEVVDFMPIDRPTVVSDRRRIYRTVRMIRGQMSFVLDCQPRFDFGRRTHKVDLVTDTAVFHADGTEMALYGVEGARVTKDEDIHLEFRLGAGVARHFLLETGAHRGSEAAGHDAQVATFQSTVAFWRGWLSRCTYAGRWRETVLRSAMALKLMTYAPTGALVAAPTAGLPEQVGGTRNWDYRFTWVRDSSFSIYALESLGYTEEARALLHWLGARVADSAGGNGSGPLKIMYRVDGSSDLVEEELDHFEGYMGSRPVRIGNGAADQLQLDIYGEAMESLYQADSIEPMGFQGWTKLRAIIDWLSKNWDQPDEGVWETRGGRKPFTYARVMSWVAMDRAVRMAQNRGRPGDVEGWVSTRDAIYEQIMSKCWNPKRQAFVQYPGTDVLDAINLMMPVVDFVAPRDPMWLSTLDAMKEELVTDSLVYRYNPSASPDGLPGSEGTFSLCSFFYVNALSRSGRLEEAQFAFEKMLTYANHVGLYSEEIDPNGMQIGNFPQAFTHLALIHAALELNSALDRPGASELGSLEGLMLRT